MEDSKYTAKESCVNNEKLRVHADDFSDLDRGWSWIVMFASFFTFCIIGGLMHGVGIIHMALIKKYEEEVYLTSWAGTLQTALSSFGGLLSTVVADRFSCRTAVILSGILLTSGYLCTAFAPNIHVAIFTCGILAGLGGGVSYTANTVVVGMNFKRRRNLALGFSLSGVGGGLFALAPLMQLALNFYGPVGFFIILATISANMITFGVIYFPSKLELHTQKMRKFEAKYGNPTGTANNSLKAYWKALFKKPIVCLCISMFAYGAGIYTIFLYLPTFIESAGFSGMQASFFLSLNGIVSVISRLVTGAVATIQCVNEIWLYSGSMFVVAFATFLYPFTVASFAGQIVFMSLFGLSFGVSYVMLAPVGIRFVGINYVSAAIGIQLFFVGIGSIVGPVCAGLIIDNGGTYKQCFIIAAASVLVGAICSSSTVFCSLKTMDQPDNTETGELLVMNGRETTV